MSRAYLIIQKVSFDHITHIAGFIHNALSAGFGPETNLIVCDQIDDADYVNDAIIFVIGEGFRPHRRRPGCIYVYLNFSILRVLGNPMRLSKVGWSAIKRKRRMLVEKLEGFDVLLDYFPPQTKRLQRQLPIPVMGFGIAVDPNVIGKLMPLRQRPFDICFVGAMTPRRQKVIDALRALGLRVSAHNGVIYEDMAAQSRCCVNIHAYRSNHLETPRIIGALAAGTPVVTEPSYGLNTLLPEGFVTQARLSFLARTAAKLCQNPDVMERDQHKAQTWYKQIYLPQCAENWAHICCKIAKIA